MTPQERIAELEKLLDRAAGALADIAFSKDLDLQAVRNKAKRHYEAIRAKELANENREPG